MVTEIWVGIRELVSDDMAAEIAETRLREQKIDSDPSDLNGDELRQQLIARWDAIYTWQKNVEWHQRQLQIKRQQRKALLKTISRGHHRYKLIPQVIEAHQVKVIKLQKRIDQEQPFMTPFEEETRIRMIRKD